MYVPIPQDECNYQLSQTYKSEKKLENEKRRREREREKGRKKTALLDLGKILPKR